MPQEFIVGIKLKRFIQISSCFINVAQFEFRIRHTYKRLHRSILANPMLCRLLEFLRSGFKVTNIEPV